MAKPLVVNKEHQPKNNLVQNCDNFFFIKNGIGNLMRRKPNSLKMTPMLMAKIAIVFIALEQRDLPLNLKLMRMKKKKKK